MTKLYANVSTTQTTVQYSLQIATLVSVICRMRVQTGRYRRLPRCMQWRRQNKNAQFVPKVTSSDYCSTRTEQASYTECIITITTCHATDQHLSSTFRVHAAQQRVSVLDR